MNDTISVIEKIHIFKVWLVANGARFPKIEWPSLDTTGGVRGAVATAAISTNEAMIEIPAHMMMSPPIAFASDIGVYLRQNKDILKSDLLLTVFIMSERSKGSSSFFYPFLQILPEPGTIASWLDKDLLHLQDDALHVRAKGRLILIESTYNRTVVALSERHPEIFPLDKFTFENFKFSWFTIMARAFGKRLPWTSLVPFADCLNHSNLQTKYDYDENNNGLFRLFPSGNNSYSRGSEVFNSYGRRANDNLLLDYGFSMLGNMWDKYEILLSLPLIISNYEKKKNVLASLGYSSSLSISLNNNDTPISALGFLRIVSLSESELDYLLSTVKQPILLHDGTEEEIPIFQRLLSSTLKEEKRKCFNRILSFSNELCAIKFLLEILKDVVRNRETSTEDDEILLSVLTDPNSSSERTTELFDSSEMDNTECPDSDSLKDVGVEEGEKWKIQCAVTYRLTRKYIIDKNIVKLTELETFFSNKLTRKNEIKRMNNAESENVDVPSSHLNCSRIDSNADAEHLCLTSDGFNLCVHKIPVSGLGSTLNGEEERIGGSHCVDSTVLPLAEPSLKMSGLQRELAMTKFELELYAFEANSNKLAAEII